LFASHLLDCVEGKHACLIRLWIEVTDTIAPGAYPVMILLILVQTKGIVVGSHFGVSLKIIRFRLIATKAGFPEHNP